MSKQRFFTRQKANEGVRLPLFDPFTGEATDEWLHILGRDSDAFRKEEAASLRRMVELVKGATPGKEAELAAKLEEAEATEKRLVIASLVSAWSFPEPCTRDAAVALLQEAPQIQDAINRAAAMRSLFSVGVSSDLPGTPSANSASTSDRKDPSSPPEST